MRLHRLSAMEIAKAVGVGIASAILLSIIAIAGQMTGISPMPKPLGLAFAQLVLGPVPLPVGLFFHVVYVTFWAVVYAALFRTSLTFLNALGLGLFLWLLVLVLFFPLVGWGSSACRSGRSSLSPRWCRTYCSGYSFGACRGSPSGRDKIALGSARMSLNVRKRERNGALHV